LASLLTRTARDTAGKASQQAADESALFDDEDERGNAQSKQHVKSRRQGRLAFEGLRRTDAGHQIQDVRELMEIPVIVTADMTKSPPVLVVYACKCGASVWGERVVREHTLILIKATRTRRDERERGRSVGSGDKGDGEESESASESASARCSLCRKSNQPSSKHVTSIGRGEDPKARTEDRK
jgi:hypothetical protein